MLKRIRTVLAVVFFLCITLLFLDFTGTIHKLMGWMAKIQFLPAVMALNIGVIIGLVLLTLIFGRIYCSVICPLGVMQDLFGWIGKKRKKNRYTFSKAKNWLRFSVLILFIVTMVLGVASFVALLAPYSSYGRMAQNLFAPVYQGVNNILAYFAERAGSYAFYTVDVRIKGMATFVIAAVSFAVIGWLAFRNGRTYCNTICPVGTVLGFFARFSYLKPVMDKSKCVNCTLCVKNCKASCINLKEHQIDYSRCVACGDCIAKCNKGAISYTHAARCKGAVDTNAKNAVKENSVSGNISETVNQQTCQKVDTQRRKYLALAGTMAVAGAIKAQDKVVDGGMAAITGKEKPYRETEIVPPGALSLKNLTTHCTGCQLCVSVCPNKVLRPSDNILTLMQPRSSYEMGFCRPECTKCSEVCPAGAIRKINREQKSSIQIGHAVWDAGLCIPMVNGDHCGNCARHCPAGAITMVEVDPTDENSVKFPVVNDERCIGCGACEYVCPARPLSAIYVEGHQVHKTI